MSFLRKFRVAGEPLIRRVLHFYWRFARGATLGVRAVVIDPQGRVFLIEHSYVAGWHLPGGGAETGESMMTALRRELHEEGNIEIVGRPVMHGIFHNTGASRRDHVAVYVVREYRQDSAPQPNHEIIGHGFFSLDALPDGTSKGTHARLAEIFRGAPVSETW
ncbi:MAG: NUDIX domain-containing protein [Pseudolabrys sp.]|nr:NUDIX domain-containing protein [Pseudolabrys sp.]